MNGLDGMRYLGVDPTQPRSDAEEPLMRALNARIGKEYDRLAKEA